MVKQVDIESDVIDPVISTPSSTRGARGAVRNGTIKSIKPTHVITKNFKHRFVSATRNVTNSVQTILGHSNSRRYLLIQNIGAATAFLGFGTVPSTDGNNAVELPAGSSISFENGICPNNDVLAICITSTKLSILEASILV